MIIDILRHARAKPEDATVGDSDRQVTKKGTKKFLKVLKRYDKAQEMDPDIVFCGPELRNRQSAEIVRSFFSMEPGEVIPDPNLSPDGDPQKLLDVIAQWVADNGDDTTEVVVIGSNPALAAFFQLVHGLGTTAGQSGPVKMKKGSVAKVKVYDLGTDKATSMLRSYLPPGLAA